MRTSIPSDEILVGTMWIVANAVDAPENNPSQSRLPLPTSL